MSSVPITWNDLSRAFAALSTTSPLRIGLDQKDAKHSIDVKTADIVGSTVAVTRPPTAADVQPVRRARVAVAHPVLVAEAKLDSPAATAARTKLQEWFHLHQPATTKATYGTYKRQFIQFMTGKRYPLYGPDTGTYVSEFVMELSKGLGGRKPLASSTILGPVAGAVADFYRFNDSEWPTVSKIFKQTKSVVKKTAPAKRHAKEPLPIDLLRRAVEVALKDTNKITGLRDACIMLIMYGGLLRQSEVVALKPINVTTTTVSVDGKLRSAISIRVEHAKNDQEGKGSDRIIPALPGNPLCLFAAIQSYHQNRVYSFKHLFYNVSKNSHGQKLATNTPTHILRNRLAEANVPKSELVKYASNSLRKGGATNAIAAGNDRSLVKQHGAWRSDAGVNAYISVDKSALAELVQSIFQSSGDSDDDVSDDE